MSNPIQDFINGIVATTQATAKQNNWNPGQFGQNVSSGVGSLVGGVENLVNPLSKTNPIRVAITNPDAAGPMAKQFINQLGTSLNNTVGQPVNPKTGQLQTPSLAEAEENAYKKPVDVAANLAMGAGGIAKGAELAGDLGKVGEVGEAGDAAEAANTVKNAVIPKQPVGFQSEGMKTAGLPPIGGMRLVPKTAEEVESTKPLAAPTVPKNVTDTFLKNFTVPAKIADKINMNKTAGTVISDGIKPDFQSLQKAKDTITGGNGEFPKLISRALSDVKEPVNVSDVLQAGYDRVKAVPELADAPGKLEAFQNIMKNVFPTGENGAVNAEDAWSTMQELERRGYAYAAKSHYLTNNPYYEDLGKAFTDTAQDLQDALESKLKGVDMSKYETPQMRTNLSNVSPNLLSRYDAMPKTVDNIRAIQKPYVDLGTMMRQTNAASHTAFSNASNMAAKAIGSAAGGAAGGVGGPLGVGAGALIGSNVVSPIIEPLLRAAIEKYGPGIQLAGAKAISNFGKKGLPGLPSLPGLAKPSLSGIGATALNQPGQQTPTAQIPASSGTGTVTQQGPQNITPFYQETKPDTTGHYQINTAVNPSQSPMTYQDFVNETAGLSSNDPRYAKIKTQYDEEQSLIKNGLPSSVQSFMRNAVPVQKNANIIADKIGDGSFPMGAINHFDNLDDAAKYVDPKYQGFVTGLDGLNKGFSTLYAASMGSDPSNNMLISPKDSQQQAEAKIAYMTNFFSGTYDQYKGIYSAMSPSGTVSSQTGQIQPAAVPAPSAPTAGVNPLLMQQNFPSVAPISQNTTGL